MKDKLGICHKCLNEIRTSEEDNKELPLFYKINNGGSSEVVGLCQFHYIIEPVEILPIFLKFSYEEAELLVKYYCSFYNFTEENKEKIKIKLHALKSN